MFALFDLGNDVNIINPIFAQKLGLSIRPTNIKVQKIDGNTLNTYRMVVAAFSMTDKANRMKFFEKIFLMTDISLEVVFGMLILTLNDANIDLLDCKLR